MAEEDESAVPNGRLDESRSSLHDPVTIHASRAANGNVKLGSKKLETLKTAAGKVLDKVRPHPFAEEDRPALNEVRHDAAFNPTKVAKQYNLHRDEAAGSTRSGSILNDAVQAFTHPRKTAKNKLKRAAAGQVISGLGPLTSHANDVRFLDETDAFYHSRDHLSGAGLTHLDGDVISHGQLLEDRRDSLRAAWATSHLRRVGVVGRTKQAFPQEALLSRDDWPKWVGHLLLYFTQNFSAKYIDDFDRLPFDLETTRTYVERLIMGSGPWQAWFMKIRLVYRWQNPVRTAKFYALFVVLWYTSRVVTFLWACILYRVISNRYWSHSVRHVKDAAKRALDRESTAFQIGELMDRHRKDEWLEPLIQDIGPYLQLQLRDLADLLEVLHNFYSWKSPRKTAASLCFFGACLLVSLFASADFCMNIFWFITGNTFFLCWPVASRYPKYRMLVSPFKWVLWDIPTHAELSFQYLRNHAQTSREEMIRRKVQAQYEAEIDRPKLDSYAGLMEVGESASISEDPRGASGPSLTDQDKFHSGDGDDDASEDDDWHSATSADSVLSGDDMLGFRAHWEGMTGRLYIYSGGIRFVRNSPKREMWKLPYSELAEMWKAIGRRRKVTLGGLFDSGVLQFKSLNGAIWTLDPIKYRDEAFNCVVGFSGKQWQVLQTEPGKGRKSSGSDTS